MDSPNKLKKFLTRCAKMLGEVAKSDANSYCSNNNTNGNYVRVDIQATDEFAGLGES